MTVALSHAIVSVITIASNNSHGGALSWIEMFRKSILWVCFQWRFPLLNNVIVFTFWHKTEFHDIDTAVIQSSFSNIRLIMSTRVLNGSRQAKDSQLPTVFSYYSGGVLLLIQLSFGSKFFNSTFLLTLDLSSSVQCICECFSAYCIKLPSPIFQHEYFPR